MSSLVIGATGIVGGYIVQHLLAAGEHPAALSREQHHDPRIDWIQGDLGKPAALPSIACETLYCTADVGLLADAMSHFETPLLKRIIVFTSTSIETKINSEIVEERLHLQRLADGEQRLIAVCKAHGIGWTILRPTIIYAEGRDRNISRLAHLIGKIGCLPLMGQGSGLRQPVHAEDLAIGAIRAATRMASVNKTYALPGGETLSYREMVGRIFDALGKPRRIIRAPPFLWRAAFAVAKPFFPNANVEMGNRMAKNMVFDDTPAKIDFDWNPRGFRPVFNDDIRRR